jgi:hypothetical protein
MAWEALHDFCHIDDREVLLLWSADLNLEGIIAAGAEAGVGVVSGHADPHHLARILDELDKGVVSKFGDVALKCSKSVFDRCICTSSENDGYSDVLLRLATTGDLDGISGAETRGLRKREAGKTLED